MNSTQIFRDIRTEIEIFLKYIRKPFEHFNEKLSFAEKQKILTILLFAELIVTVAVVIPVYELVDVMIELQYADDLMNLGFYMMLFLGAVIAPIMEEFIFRLPLKWKRNLPAIILNSVSSNDKVKKAWNRYYHIIFYIVAILFGLVHLTNFDNSWTPLFILLIPFITLSQLIAGLTFGYIRNRLGFWWSFLYHALFNFILIAVPFLMYDNTNIFKIQEKGFTAEATLHAYREPRTEITIGKSPNGKIQVVDAKNIKLSVLTEAVLQEKYQSDEVEYLDFYLNSKGGITEQELFELLNKELKLEPLTKQE